MLILQSAGRCEVAVVDGLISGHHSPAFEAVCDTLAAALHARRAYVTGAGHATPETGDAFNQTLEAFIRTACRMLPSPRAASRPPEPARNVRPPA